MRRLKLILILFGTYFLIAVPFKVMGIIPGFTDIRPVVMLNPVYPVFFGIPGCIVMSLGNLVMDIVSGSLRWSSITGLIANFLGPYIIYFFMIRKSRSAFSLREGRALLKLVGFICLSAILEMVIITPAVAIIYPEVNAHLFAGSVLLNNTVFPVLFGIPVMILMKEELGFSPIVRMDK